MNQLSLYDDDGRAPVEVGQQSNQRSDLTPPASSGQCGQVLHLIRQHQPIISLRLTADYAIPEAAARVHDLRAAGWNILTTIHPSFFDGGC